MRERCDKPVVAAINGVAVGAGFSLEMSADIWIAASSARFLASYSRAGTSPDGGLTWTLQQAVGYERALPSRRAHVCAPRPGQPGQPRGA